MEDNDISWGKPTLEEIQKHFATPRTNVTERDVMDYESSAGSIDLSDSFKTLLETRRQKIEKENPPTPVSTKKTLLDKTWTPFLGRLEDTVAERSDWEPSDETFARMEEICENTLEAQALERLLDEVHDESGVDKLPEVTQIGEIEAPTFMWEQTMLHGNSPKPSPGKIVRPILRPSTIIEESTVATSTQDSREDSTLNEQENDSGATGGREEEQSSESVISIDSAGGESFITAKAELTTTESADSTKTTDSVTLYPAKKRQFFRDSLFAPVVKPKVEQNSDLLDSIDIVEVLDDSHDDDSKVDEDPNDENDQQFNNTLERMDYIFAQAEKQKILTPKAIPIKPTSPVVLTFKKPPQVTRALPKSASKSKFQHIASPIGQYIHNTAQNPSFVRHHHGLRDPRLIDEIDPRKLRETQYFGKSANTSVQESSLPKLATVAASSQRVFDNRTPIKIPGGDKINRLIGKSTPTVVKHEGRLKGTEKGGRLNAANNTIEQSFGDLSLVSGDVSVCVVKDLKRV